MFKITGLDKLQKNLKDAQRALMADRQHPYFWAAFSLHGLNCRAANASRGGFANVEFRLGEIEALPVADASAVR